MLNHPDPQMQYILATLEAQRDNLMVENGQLAGENAKLRKQLAELSPSVPSEPQAEASEAAN